MANEPVPYIPTAGVYMAMMRATGEDPAPVVRRAATEWAKQWGHKLDTMLDAAGLELAPPADRLHAFLLWQLEDWTRKWSKYPKRFRERWRDFERLKERAKAGDFGEEVEIVVRQHWSEQQ